MTRPCLGIAIAGPNLPGYDWRTFERLTEWQGPDLCPPSDACATLISSRTVARWISPGAPYRPPDSLDLFAPNKVPLIKLAVRDCDQTGDIVIDSDQSVVIFGPVASVAVLAPRGWTEATREPLPSGQWHVQLKVRICPAPCCPAWPPQLSEALRVAPGVTADRTIPRSARAFAISDAIGPTTVQWYNGDPAAGGLLIASTVYTTQGYEELVPVASHFRIAALPIVTRLFAIRWSIAP